MLSEQTHHIAPFQILQILREHMKVGKNYINSSCLVARASNTTFESDFRCIGW